MGALGLHACPSRYNNIEMIVVVYWKSLVMSICRDDKGCGVRAELNVMLVSYTRVQVGWVVPC